MADTAFEAITSRQAWYASEPVARYHGVMLDATGKYAPADGTRPFAGVVQYGAENAGDMCTVVRGTFPMVTKESIAAGDYVGVDDGFAVKVTDASAAIGIALTSATAAEDADDDDQGLLVGVSMLESAAPAAKPVTPPSGG